MDGKISLVLLASAEWNSFFCQKKSLRTNFFCLNLFFKKDKKSEIVPTPNINEKNKKFFLNNQQLSVPQS
jgi:hypothetical protein